MSAIGNQSRTALAIAWLLILVPLSVDNFWNIPLGDYHLRVSYLGAALSAFLIFATGIRNPQWRDRIASEFRGHWLIAFVMMGASGVMGMRVSAHPKRAVFFWLWAMGTLLGVPLLVSQLSLHLKRWIPRSLVIYAMIQAVLILVDSAICMPTGGAWHLGRVMIYEQFQGVALCRPHAWYQEPGYFCAFALLIALLASVAGALESSPRWVRFFKVSYGVLLFAMVMTTSRMGWLAVGLLLLTDLILRIRAGKKIEIPVFRLWMIVPLLLTLGVLGFSWNAIYQYAGKGLVAPQQDPSFRYRYQRVNASLQVFRVHPFFGVGPGTAGAYLVDHFPDDPWLKSHDSAYIQFMRRDPLSQNLYTELLSEWGMVGALAFFMMLALLFFEAPIDLRIRLAVVLACVYSATQTLSRFDLWIALSALWISTRPVERRRSKPSVR